MSLHRLLVFFFLLCMATSVCSRRIAILPEIIDPECITIHKKNIYIVEGTRIFVYSVENYKMKKSFGTYGEGPKEFLIEPKKQGYRLQIVPFSNHLLVNSMGKVTFFTLGGDFLREVKTKNGRYFKPLADKYVGYELVEASQKDKTIRISINLYGIHFVKEKSVFTKAALWQLGQTFNPIYYGIGSFRGVLFQVWDNQVFIEGPGDSIHVFDRNGGGVRVIELNLDKQRIMGPHKQATLAAIRETRLPRIYNLVKKMARFPRHFPLKYFTVADSRIYVLSFEKNKGRRPFYIFSLKGIRLHKIWLPFAETNILHYHPYTVHQRHLYQLVENLETETWELHRYRMY